VSRKFKFRVWSLSKGRFFDPYAEEDPQFALTDHEENWGVTVYTFDRQSHDFTNLYSLGQDIVIEQFSGLFDWGGKEIFEGDLCSPNKERDSSNPVFYFDGCFWLNNAPLYESHKSVWVVGNIHES
jgi:hypothetical protein